MNSNDEIVNEVRAARDAYAARFDYDLTRMYEDLKLNEKSFGREIASLRPLQPEQEVVVER